MHKFEVWAPIAESVTVQVDGRQFPLQGAGRGYWVAEVETAQAGMDYGYILDGQGPAIPDPRSPCSTMQALRGMTSSGRRLRWRPR
jgi:maltooligosyltrehalose trehalohydrolase